MAHIITQLSETDVDNERIDIDFIVRRTAEGADLRCESTAARRVAYDLDSDADYPAEFAPGSSFMPGADRILAVPADEVERVLSDLETWGYEVEEAA